jgi:hypothetical protein
MAEGEAERRECELFSSPYSSVCRTSRTWTRRTIVCPSFLILRHSLAIPPSTRPSHLKQTFSRPTGTRQLRSLLRIFIYSSSQTNPVVPPLSVPNPHGQSLTAHSSSHRSLGANLSRVPGHLHCPPGDRINRLDRQGMQKSPEK